MPFTFNDDGTFATVPQGDTGRRIPTQANLDELAGGGGAGVTVDNGTDPPAAIATILSGMATIAGDEATLLPGVEYDADDLLLRIHGEETIAIVFDDPAEPSTEYARLEDVGLTLKSDSATVSVATEGGAQDAVKASASGGLEVYVGASRALSVIHATGDPVYFQVLPSGAVFLPSLPTADPVSAGQLWNDAGVLKVSAG